MNPPKCDELDDIHVLVAAQHVFSTTEAARCHPCAGTHGPAHDAYTRLLHRCQADGNALWEEGPHGVSLTKGFLVIDDTTLDKPYSRAMELVTRHWSGNHQRVVLGINLVSLLWTDGEACLPCDVRIYDKAHDGLTRNDHVQAMVKAAAERGLRPRLLGFDRWYASLANVTLGRSLTWQWLTQLKANRLVDPDGSGNQPIRDVPIPRHGLPAAGRRHRSSEGIRVRQRVHDGSPRRQHCILGHQRPGDERRPGCRGRPVPVAHRSGPSRYQAVLGHRASPASLRHCPEKSYRPGACLLPLPAAGRGRLRAFLRLERYRLRTGTSWFEAKAAIVREAIRAYLSQPLYTQISTA